MRMLMWFRSDLRVADNSALHHACKDADDGVIAVFAVCPKQWAEHDWGRAKVDFVLGNLAALSKSLGELNIPLLIVQADWFSQVPAKLWALAKRHSCDAIYFNREYEVNELERDQKVADLFGKHGRTAKGFTDQIIVETDRLRTGAGGLYKVFTPFKKKWCELLKEEGLPHKWSKPRRQQPLKITASKVPTTLKRFAGASHLDLWPVGEREAQRRLKVFVSKRIDKYQTARDLPALEGTSELSPYLAIGAISPRQCLDAALSVNNGRFDSGKKGAVTWISELVWREFYRYVMVGFSRVSMGVPFKEETDQLPWRYDEEQFEAWCQGRTGFPIVDAGMRQLAETGWMHNRLRMIVAMFLSKDLFIDWRWGERFFMQHLVDGDLASNNGGWQWSASTGTDAVPYFRIFNPVNQSKRFDASGEFIRRFVPELSELSASEIHNPSDKIRDELGYPRAIVDRRTTRDLVMSAFRRLPRG